MIDILLATYNGEQFVEQQIRSIMHQTEHDWRLLVHDDGSTDQTVNIITQLSHEDSRIQLIQDSVTHLGVAYHFLHLLQYADADYLMFADQDDIWFDNKVAKMLAAITQQDNSKPQVVYANAYLWKDNSTDYSGLTTLTFPTTLRQLLFLNTGIQGASAIFNRAMLEQMRVPVEHCAMHDHLLTLAGITLGEVHYLHEPLMKYRIHTHNVTGDAPGSMCKKLLLAWHNRKEPLVSKAHYEGVRSFYNAHQNSLTATDKHLMQDFLAMPNLSPIKRMITIVQDRFQLFDSTILLVGKLCLRRYIAYKS